jgi:hypothetical protein
MLIKYSPNIQSDEIVLVDIDLAKINVPESLNLKMFPSHYVEILKSEFKKIDFNTLETKRLTRFLILALFSS